MVPKYSILIVGYRSLSYVPDCIASLLRDQSVEFEVLFLDNGSPEPEADFVRHRFSHHALRVFRTSENLFFAGGNNYLAARARGRYLLLLNPDTVAAPDLLETIDAYLEGRIVHAAQLDLRDLEGGAETQGCFIDRLGFIVHAPPLSAESGRRLIFSGRGAALLVRRETFAQAGGFDERFQMYFEETDLCWRLGLAGYEVDFIEGAVVTHRQGGSHRDQGLDYRELRFVRNRIWSLFKNQGPFMLGCHLPLHLVLCAALALRKFHRPRVAAGILLGLAAGVVRLPLFIRDRKRIQAERRRSDAFFLERGLIKSRYKYSLRRQPG